MRRTLPLLGLAMVMGLIGCKNVKTGGCDCAPGGVAHMSHSSPVGSPVIMNTSGTVPAAEQVAPPK